MTPKARQLAEANIRLVGATLRRYKPLLRPGMGIDASDLLSAGYIGLCSAAEKWDPNLAKFSTYAINCIQREMIEELRRATRRTHGGNTGRQHRIRRTGPVRGGGNARRQCSIRRLVAVAPAAALLRPDGINLLDQDAGERACAERQPVASGSQQPESARDTDAARAIGGKRMNPIELVIPWDPHRTSDNEIRRVHWSERHTRYEIAKTVARAVWAQVGRPTAAGKVRASFVVRRGRQMDPANVIGGLKPVIDGLFVRGITPDDSAKYLEIGSVRVESGKQWRGRPEIVVTVEEL